MKNVSFGETRKNVIYSKLVYNPFKQFKFILSYAHKKFALIVNFLKGQVPWSKRTLPLDAVFSAPNETIFFCNLKTVSSGMVHWSQGTRPLN